MGCCWLTAWLWAIPLAVVCGALMAGRSVGGWLIRLAFGLYWLYGDVMRFNWYYIVLSPPKWLILPLVTIHLEWGYCRAYLALRIETLTTKLIMTYKIGITCYDNDEMLFSVWYLSNKQINFAS